MTSIVLKETQRDGWLNRIESSEMSHKTLFFLFFLIDLLGYFFFFYFTSIWHVLHVIHILTASVANYYNLIFFRLFPFYAAAAFVSPACGPSLCISTVFFSSSRLRCKAKLSSFSFPLLIQSLFPPQCFHQLSCRHISSRCSLFYIYHIKPICILFHPHCAFKTTNFSAEAFSLRTSKVFLSWSERFLSITCRCVCVCVCVWVCVRHCGHSLYLSIPKHFISPLKHPKLPALQETKRLFLSGEKRPKRLRTSDEQVIKNGCEQTDSLHGIGMSAP